MDLLEEFKKLAEKATQTGQPARLLLKFENSEIGVELAAFPRRNGASYSLALRRNNNARQRLVIHLEDLQGLQKIVNYLQKHKGELEKALGTNPNPENIIVIKEEEEVTEKPAKKAEKKGEKKETDDLV